MAQVDNLKTIIGVKRGDRMGNEKIKELVYVKKEIDDVINESTKRWYNHIKRRDENVIVKRMFSSKVTSVIKVGKACKK